MRVHRGAALGRILGAVACLVLAGAAGAAAQNEQANASSQKQQTYRTFYLSNPMQLEGANEIVSDMRNILSHARVFYVQSQNAISVLGTSEELDLAQKMVSDLNHSRLYRITYTMTDVDSGKPAGSRQVALVVASGGNADLRQGVRMPIVTGVTHDGTSTPNSEVQYIDLGLSIDAQVNGYADGLRLKTKVEQSGQADEKSAIGTQDPVIRQTMVRGDLTLTPGKSQLLGSLDLPGSTRHEEITVSAELLR